MSDMSIDKSKEEMTIGEKIKYSKQLKEKEAKERRLKQERSQKLRRAGYDKRIKSLLEEYEEDLESNDGILSSKHSLLLESVKEGRRFGIVKSKGDLLFDIIDDKQAYMFVKGCLVAEGEEVELISWNEEDVDSNRDILIFNLSKGKIMKHMQRYNLNLLLYFTGGHFELKKNTETVLKVAKAGDGIKQLEQAMRVFIELREKKSNGDNLIICEKKKLNHLQYYRLKPFWY